MLYKDPITGRVVDAYLSEAVDELLVKIRHKGIWEIVEFCRQVWAMRFPDDAKKWDEEMKKYKRNRLKSTAATKNNTLRELATIPPLMNLLLDKLASDKIAEYGSKKFYREFAKRYPGFSPAETV